MGEIYELAPVPPTPRLPGTVVVRETPDEVVDAIAADLLLQAHQCVRTFGDFHIALSGGSTPVPLYMRLMYDPAYRELPWRRTHLWIVDERRVPFDDERSNFKLINEIIGDHSDIPREQIHPIFAMADDAAVQYERALQETLAWREKGQDRLDYVLLGMGDDGHTASLFPHSPALREEMRLVAVNAGPTVTPPDRVTMTYRMLNASRLLSVMVTGTGKRPALGRVESAWRSSRAKEEGAAEELPILGISPIGGELRWYLDYEACPGGAGAAAAAPRG